MAWKFCHPDTEVPELLRDVEDRDLWKFQLPYAKELLAALDSYSTTFEVWDELMKRFNNPEGVANILKEGNAILRYNHLFA